MSKNILLISDAMIKERTEVHGNIDPKLIYPHIKVAQDMYIERILGTSLFNKLLDGVKNNNLSGDYKTLTDDYIADTLIYYTLSELPQPLSFQTWNKGVVRKQGENTELATMSELIDLANFYKNRAEFYSDRLRRYLLQNAPTKFPEYLNPGTGLDDVKPSHRSFTNPVWLGDDDCVDQNDPHRFEKKYQGNRPNCCDD